MEHRLHEFECSTCGKKFLSQKRSDQTRRCCSHFCAGKLSIGIGEKKGGAKAIPLSVRFNRYCQKKGPDDCWIWSGPIGGNGYGNLTDHEKYLAAHRISWSLFIGPIPEKAFVCHTCDNPLCVNPNHLFLGDSKINMDDAKKKGRLHSTGKKLTTNQKFIIRSRKYSGHKTKDVAEDFGISTRHVRYLLNHEAVDGL